MIPVTGDANSLWGDAELAPVCARLESLGRAAVNKNWARAHCAGFAFLVEVLTKLDLVPAPGYLKGACKGLRGAKVTPSGWFG